MQYQYTPLAAAIHIRVLLLAPAENSEAPLHCSFEQLDPDDPKACYKAISYTWGDQPLDQDLYCEGAIIKVTSNLSAALRRFRSTSKISRLWADAVCINQIDTAEKSLQIPLMSKIYRSAESVKIWLGDGAEEYTRAIEAIKLAARSDKRGAVLLESEVTAEGVPATRKLTDDVRRFFELPWFTRRWVVQELVLNSNPMFYCGKSKISWTTVHLACSVWSHEFWGVGSDAQIGRKLRRLGHLWQTWSYSRQVSSECDFFTLIDDFKDLKCKETRDIIYTFAGLATDIETLAAPPANPVVNRLPLVVPNYGISDNDVFQSFALEILRSGRILRTLALASAYQSSQHENSFGSWVPDLRLLRSRKLFVRDDDPDFELAEVPQRTGGKLKLKIKMPIESSVTKLAENFDTSSDQSFTQSLKMWIKRIVDSDPGYRNDVDQLQWVFEMMERTRYGLIQELLHNIVSKQMEEEDLTSPLKKTSLKVWMHANMPSENLPGEKWVEHARIALSRHRLFYWSSTYFHRHGHIDRFGVGPYDLQEGDKILAPSKGDRGAPRIALFLRPVSDGYQVLGDGHIVQCDTVKHFGGAYQSVSELNLI